ncbi:hypothetical protein BUALT_Bualt01G0203400 [Buddleja alternifolia]|uniref:Uncharacterized protein n=1 Tax=Buddleja alternifolia TaxID=168488 RepID=A0AAV6YF63_9LAMI|nr:hypothetical protein BUALT_Bualt01G0203400 [Buddleja alternifolia]
MKVDIQNRRSIAVALHPKSPGTTIFHDGFNLKALLPPLTRFSTVPTHRNIPRGSSLARRRNIQEHGGGPPDDGGNQKRKLYLQPVFSTAA